MAHLTSEYLSELNKRIHVSFISDENGKICFSAAEINLSKNCNKLTLHDRNLKKLFYYGDWLKLINYLISGDCFTQKSQQAPFALKK